MSSLIISTSLKHKFANNRLLYLKGKSVSNGNICDSPFLYDGKFHTVCQTNYAIYFQECNKNDNKGYDSTIKLVHLICKILSMYNYTVLLNKMYILCTLHINSLFIFFIIIRKCLLQNLQIHKYTIQNRPLTNWTVQCNFAFQYQNS